MTCHPVPRMVYVNSGVCVRTDWQPITPSCGCCRSRFYYLGLRIGLVLLTRLCEGRCVVHRFAKSLSLRRAGRFDRELAMGIPDQDSREKMLRVLVRKLRVQGELDFKQLAHITPGFVGADLHALTTEVWVTVVSIHRCVTWTCRRQ